MEEFALSNPFVYDALMAPLVFLGLRRLFSCIIGLIPLGLCLDRVEDDANVEVECRRFGLFRRVSHPIWTPGGEISGATIASRARKGLVIIASRTLHRHWRRPRDLMPEHVLLAVSPFFAWPKVVAMRAAPALWTGRATS